jgi:hypothetical protein
MSEDKEAEVFYVFLRTVNGPIKLFSSVDLVQYWENEMELRAKKGDWWRMIALHDDDKESTCIGLFSCYDVIGIVRGIIPPAEKLPGILEAALRRGGTP